MHIQLSHSFEDIISVENLLLAWQEFLSGKRNKPDVQVFESQLMDHILQLHQDLVTGRYRHGGYYQFNISDPKSRIIHKASVRDRILHHAIYRTLYPFFDKIFAGDSYSCRISKGTHKAMDKFRIYARKASHNNTRTCWVLKGDIKKFFANIDHAILLGIITRYIPDLKTMLLLEEVIDSFNSPLRKVMQKIPPLTPPKLRGELAASSPDAGEPARTTGVAQSGGVRRGIGLPLGNLTSQLFCNIYMNEFDQFVKHKLKAKYYIRYADDFIVISDNRRWLVQQVDFISTFLEDRLNLQLHPDKLFIKTLASGVDFLGWVHFPRHRVLRTTTRRRMMKGLIDNPTNQTLQSYLGLLKLGQAFGLAQVSRNTYQLFTQKF